MDLILTLMKFQNYTKHSGEEFEKKYTEYESRAKSRNIKKFKEVDARDLPAKKMLGMLFETGHPWVTFKDPQQYQISTITCRCCPFI